MVERLLEKMEQQLAGEGVKTSVGDYIRLMQLQKELEETEPKEIRVTWVDPEGSGHPEGTDHDETAGSESGE